MNTAPKRKSLINATKLADGIDAFNLNIKLRDTKGDGQVEIASVLDALYENWDKFQEALGDLEEFETQSIKEYFNGLSQSGGEIGERMFHVAYDGDDDLRQLLSELGPVYQGKFVNALVDTKIIDKDYI